MARPPATCPPCHYSKQKVLLTVIFLVCSKYNCSLWLTDTQAQFNYPNSNEDVTEGFHYPSTLPRKSFVMSDVVRSGDRKTSRRDVDVTAWRYVTTRCDVTWRQMSWEMDVCYLHRSAHQKIWKSRFFQNGALDLWPMTLTIELIRDIITGNVHSKF